MHDNKIHCIFHYIPLHNSKAGKKFGRIGSDMEITEDLSSRIVRLPLWVGLNPENITQAINKKYF